MASQNKDGDVKVVNYPATQSSNTQVYPDDIDLDKNPIKYGTHEPGMTTLEPHDKEYMEMTLRSGQHSSLVQRLLRQRIELRAKEFPRWPADISSGVRSMWIESRFWYDRERLGPDFDQDWREYRAKYLHSLELDPREPVYVPEYEKFMINPIRRFYMRAGDWYEEKVVKRILGSRQNKHRNALIRSCTFISIASYLSMVGLYYLIRYNHRTWEDKNGVFIATSKPIMFSNDPRFPFKDYKTEPGHHYDTGFSKRTIYKDLRDYEDMSVIL